MGAFNNDFNNDFDIGVLSSVSTYPLSGKIISCNKKTAITLTLNNIGDDTYYGTCGLYINNFFQSNEWSFHAETKQDEINYISFPDLVTNVTTNQYGNISVIIPFTIIDGNIASYSNPIYFWGKTSDGLYRTPKISFYISNYDGEDLTE